MTKVKICGLKRPQDVSMANVQRPDYVGFVFWPKSSRFVTPEQARTLRRQLDRRITPVGVFVDEAVGTVAGLMNQGVIAMAQLHGSEDEAYIAELRRLAKGPVIKAFKVRGAGDVAAAAASSADYVLLDAGMGGGERFDWSVIGGLDRPFFLAGGLDPQNVAGAIRRVHPFAVDVSSGVETRGAKDLSKVWQFMNAVRAADG